MIKGIREEKKVQVLNGWKELKVIKIRKGTRATIALCIAWLWENCLKFLVIGIGTLILFAIAISLSAWLTYSAAIGKVPLAVKVFIFLISPAWILISLFVSGLFALKIYEILLGPIYDIIKFFATLPIRQNFGSLPASVFRPFLKKFSEKRILTPGWIVDSELLELGMTFYAINPEKFKEAIKKAKNKKELFCLFALIERR